MHTSKALSRFHGRNPVGDDGAAPSITPAPDDFTPTKLDELEKNQGADTTEDVKVPDISEIPEDMIEAARAAGIKDPNLGTTGPEDAPEDGASGASGVEEGATGATAPEGASGPTSPEGASGASGVSDASGATAPEGETRDQDLEKPLNPNTHPKTKAIINEFKGKVVEARNEVAKLKTELETLKKQGGTGVPEDVKKELETLRERVREFDILQDPQIKAKYDAKIETNTNRVIEILKDKGFGTDEEGKNFDPKKVEALKAAGINLKTVGPLIKDLEKAGEFEAAQSLKDLLKENSKLSTEKQKEITDYKTNFETRQKEQAEAQKREVENYSQTLIKETDNALKAEADKFPQIQRPPAVLPTDAPAVKKAKEAAIEAYNKEFEDFKKNLGEAWKDNLSMSKISALGVLYKNHIVPKMTKELESYKERVKTLEAELGKVKKAGATSRIMATSKPTDSKPKDKSEDSSADPMDAMREAAKAAGINVDS